jgi:hypothetical protein
LSTFHFWQDKEGSVVKNTSSMSYNTGKTGEEGVAASQDAREERFNAVNAQFIPGISNAENSIPQISEPRRRLMQQHITKRFPNASGTPDQLSC